MLQLTDKKKNFFLYLFLFLLLSTLTNKNLNTKKNHSIKINQLEVHGLSEEGNFKVYRDLEPLLYSNILFIKKNQFIKILKKNNLIDTFLIQKKYPNLIIVNIKKTDFLAITNIDNKKFIIGSNGKLIQFTDLIDPENKLPFVFGRVNLVNFIDFKKIIDESEFKFETIESFYYYPSSRWDIKTKDKVLIKLPENNLSNTLKIMHSIFLNETFKKNKILDLRIVNNIITSND